MSDKVGKALVAGLVLAVSVSSAYVAKLTSDYREKKRKKALDQEFSAIDKKISEQKRVQGKR
ncbi:hypothetical protein EQ836_24345 [Ectopseudomonas mendocina]|uniref:Uncharacterized protein n=1 Tax=Ectopseudomonas mendocina TaxID=300 RepID=A0ABD7RQJ6_ECTME|nr:hypothetical protein [Pseudomonas mendocina]TRO09184.1 hypothetical protein EQ829_23140 [Pseudomonas mendocina]TRO11348.1 hypothetical protein EQ836_24345 [Pseudomonas mendocina]